MLVTWIFKRYLFGIAQALAVRWVYLQKQIRFWEEYCFTHSFEFKLSNSSGCNRQWFGKFRGQGKVDLLKPGGILKKSEVDGLKG